MFFGRNNQNRRWNERPQLYRGRFYFIKRLMQVLLVFAGVAGLVSGVAYFRNSDTLSIRSVEVLGELTHLTRDDVIVLSEISMGDKLFSLNLSEVQKNIRRHPWIKQVRVRREFPDKIQIYVTERQAKAVLMSGEAYLIDQKGEVFKKLDGDNFESLPIVTGFDVDEMQRYPLISRRSLDEVMSFLDFVVAQEFFQNDHISEVHYDRVFGYTVFTRDTGLEIYYGRDDYQDKHRKLERFRLSSQYEQSAFIRLDLDSKDKVVARRL